MTMQTCSQTWMAEAIEDARLGDVECAAFERHAAVCPACSRAVAELARLREVMTQVPVAEISDVERHRQRAHLLERANRLWGRPRGRAWKLSLAAAAVVLLAVGGTSLYRSSGFSTGRVLGRNASAQQPPTYEVTGLAQASFTREEVGPVARVRLAGGSAEFHVHHLRAGQRFLVALPDGEIEVRGTRFVVAVKGQGTSFVVVTEGKVVLRRPGEPERLLFAGDRWDRPRASENEDISTAEARNADPGAVAAASTAGATRHAVPGAASPAPAVKPTAVAARTLAMTQQTHGRARSRAQEGTAGSLGHPKAATDTKSDTSVRATREVDSADSFAAGIAAFRAGRYRDADRLLQAFASKNPTDPRVEDAAFLRAVAHSRLGDTSGAAALARDYLGRYPNGLRRPEAEALFRRAP